MKTHGLTERDSFCNDPLSMTLTPETAMTKLISTFGGLNTQYGDFDTIKFRAHQHFVHETTKIIVHTSILCISTWGALHEVLAAHHSSFGE